LWRLPPVTGLYAIPGGFAPPSFLPYRSIVRVLESSLAIVFLAGPLVGQPAPWEGAKHLSGSLAVGWMDSKARGRFDEHIQNPFTTLKLDYRSYILSPYFITYRVQPQLSSGFQGGVSGVSEGSGLAFETSFLPMSRWPFRFRYSRIERPLLMAADNAFTRFLSNNSDSLLELDWRHIVPNRAVYEVSYSLTSNITTPEAIAARGSDVGSKNFSLSGRDKWKRWLFNGYYNRQDQRRLAILGSQKEGTDVLFGSDYTLDTAGVYAQRPIRESLLFSASAVRTANQGVFTTGDYQFDYSNVSAGLQYAPGARLRASIRGQYTGNFSQYAANPENGLTPALLPPTEQSNGRIEATAEYLLHPTLRLFGRGEYTSITAPPGQNLNLTGSVKTAGGGVNHSWSNRWLSLATTYSIFVNATRLVGGSPGDSRGHALDTSASVGTASTVRTTGSFTLIRSRQRFDTPLPYEDNSERIRLAVSRRIVGRWTGEVFAGLYRSRFNRAETNTNLDGREYGGRLDGRRMSAYYNRTILAGESFFLLIPGVTDTSESGFLDSGALLNSSSTDNTTATASLHPARQLTIRGVYRARRQTLGPQLASWFEQQEAWLEWRFRKLRFEAGYILYKYQFSGGSFRKAIIFRWVRDFRVF